MSSFHSLVELEETRQREFLAWGEKLVCLFFRSFFGDSDCGEIRLDVHLSTSKGITAWTISRDGHNFRPSPKARKWAEEHMPWAWSLNYFYLKISRPSAHEVAQAMMEGGDG